MATTGKGLPRSLKGAEISAEWADVTGKPTTFPPVTGTSASSAMPGNKFVQGPVVAAAAGATPTKAEFDALLAALRTAKIIAT